MLKPPGMSSNDVVSHLRRILGVKKVGHTGTLDPGAAGVLPVCVGRATKLADYIMDGEKEYIAEITFGARTDTLDSYGALLEQREGCITQADIAAVLPAFSGEIWQAPPAYSAVKHNGQPLYKLARRGVVVEKPPRKVCVYKITLLSGNVNRFLLKIRCSKGTYIRTLLEEIGNRLLAPAYTSFLLRTESGGFRVEDAHTFDEISAAVAAGAGERFLIPMEQAVAFLPHIFLKDYLYEIVMSGTPVDLEKAGICAVAGADYALFCKNELIGIARCEDTRLKITARVKI